jgi:hypothetical protein
MRFSVAVVVLVLGFSLAGCFEGPQGPQGPPAHPVLRAQRAQALA